MSAEMTDTEYQYYSDNYAGYCTHCEDITNESGVEPDAKGYECEQCGNETVMGLENALLEGHIYFT